MGTAGEKGTFENPIIDCEYERKEVEQYFIKKCKTEAEKLKLKKILENMKLVTVKYYGFDGRIDEKNEQPIIIRQNGKDNEWPKPNGKLHQGQIFVHENTVKNWQHVFEYMQKNKFPMIICSPINFEQFPDGNVSFNYRITRGGKKLSAHSYGIATDFNSYRNPAIIRGKKIPSWGKYNPEISGTLTSDSQFKDTVGYKIIQKCKELGFKWLGEKSKDYMHLEIPHITNQGLINFFYKSAKEFGKKIQNHSKITGYAIKKLVKEREGILVFTNGDIINKILKPIANLENLNINEYAKKIGIDLVELTNNQDAFFQGWKSITQLKK